MALQEAAQSQVKDTQKGKVLIRARANGTEAFYALPPSHGLSATDISEAISSVLDTADELVAETPTIDDGALAVALIARFPSVIESRPDFTSLRR